MNTIFFILICLSTLAVTTVLGIGLYGLSKGGEFNEKYGNKLMRLRIILQGVTILLLALAAVLAQN